MIRMLPASIALALIAGGCAGKKKETLVPKSEGPARAHLVQGQLEFYAQYKVGTRYEVPPEAQMPKGQAPLRSLRVCLYEKRGRNDFRWYGRAENDVRLGCTQTDATGHYKFNVRPNCPKVGPCDKFVYLVTALCVWHQGKPEVCAVTNTDQGGMVANTPWTRDVEFRKFIWSEHYRLSLDHRTSTLIAWNLSCPGERGEGRESILCEKPEREGRWGGANSNHGWNVEAVHAVEAGAQLVSKFGSLKPTPKNTRNPSGHHCGGPKDKRKQNRTDCNDAIRLVISNMRKFSFDGDAECQRWLRAADHARTKRTICLANPLDAFVIAHEIGHAIHVRWMNYKGGINAGKVKWRMGGDQKSMTGEGWADFVSAAAWYEPSAKRPTFDGGAIEQASHKQLRGTCIAGAATGEGRAAQFFWDLYDPVDPEEPEDDVEVDFWTLARVWSLMEGGNGRDERNRTKGECSPHGRNVKDYLHYYDRYPDRDLPDPRQVLEFNCLHRQLDGVSCDEK